MSEKRINPVTGIKEQKLENEGLPDIWVELTAGFCDRCRPFNECLSFKEIDNETWEKLDRFVESINEGKVILTQPAPKSC